MSQGDKAMRGGRVVSISGGRIVGGLVLALLLGAVAACADSQPSDNSGPRAQDSGRPGPDSSVFTTRGTGGYQSSVFQVQGGTYAVAWRVQQTRMGAVVPCSIRADLWSEAGHYQGSLIWGDPGNSATSGPPDAGRVTVRMPAGRWYLDIGNSCSDSQSVVQIARTGG